MAAGKDIFSLLKEQEGKAATAARQAIIIQPGAIGDCILTLPLAQFARDALHLGNVVFLGHPDYTGIFMGRTCVDGVKSIESVELHRLFADRKKFDLEDGDPLLTAFAPYSWIVTFLGEPDSDFEHNLIYTAHCTHSAEVVTLPLRPPASCMLHISRYYVEEFAAANAPPLTVGPADLSRQLIIPTDMDKLKGAELFRTLDIDTTSAKTIVIAPGAGSLSKCWAVENFIAVARELMDKDFKIVFLLGPAERDKFSSAVMRQLSETAQCISDLSLTEVLQLLSASYGFIGNDSGISHLAGAIGIRTVAIFGPTQSDVYRPCGPNVQALQLTAEEFGGISPTHQKHIVDLACKL